MKNGSWEDFKEKYRKGRNSCEWTFERIRESGKGRNLTDFLRRIIAPVDGMGGVTLSCVCPHCNSFALEDYIWWVSTGHGDGHNRKKKLATGGVRLVEANTNGERPTGYWCSSV